MSPRASLALLLTVLLLVDSLNCVNWQGTGSGLNNTVMTEIWKNLEANIDQAVKSMDDAVITGLTKEMSERLNARWSSAWNVVLLMTSSVFDSIFYGYAFRDQWMWYNGVPFASQSYNSAATLIVWKDYNCHTWKNIRAPNSDSTFNTEQKSRIDTLVGSIDASSVRSDVWQVAFQFANSLQAASEFTSGAVSVVLTQDGDSSFYGYVCSLNSNFYYPGSIPAGRLLVFQTR